MENSMNSVLESKKLFVFDMDGTIYLGGIPFDFAVRYINNLRKSGNYNSLEFMRERFLPHQWKQGRHRPGM